MKQITTISKKYDGTVRDQGKAYLVEETAEAYTLLTLPQAKYWLPRKQAWLHAPDGLLQIFSKHSYYNIWHICEQNSGLNLMYINIAMPATLQNEVLEWVDLDLDYRVYLDGTFEQIDQQDFKENKMMMGYPAELIRQVEKACTVVEAGLNRRTYPFNHHQQTVWYQQFRQHLSADHF